MKMRDSGRDDVRDQLLTLSGVGPKVGIISSLIRELWRISVLSMVM